MIYQYVLFLQAPASHYHENDITIVRTKHRFIW